MMANEWKTGDKAMVTIIRGSGDDEGAHYLVYALPDGRKNFWITPGCLSPLPPAITPEAQAVLDAALVWMDVPHSLNGDMPLLHVARTYRASITPPDPIAELIAQAKEAVGQLIRNDCHTGGSLLSEAIAAVEAIRKPKV
jgi:hypothetical protein